MTMLAPTPAGPGFASDLSGAFARHLEAQSHLPDWWIDMKRSAFEEFQSLPMPSRKQEEWRFSRLQSVSFDEFNIGSEGTDGDFPVNENRIADYAGRIVHHGSSLSSFDTIPEDLSAKGVVWAPFEKALQSHGDTLRDFFMAKDPHLGSDKFAALHKAFITAGSFLYVPKSVEITEPFLSYHCAGEEGSVLFPHTLIILEEFASATVMDIFHATRNNLRALAIGANHLFTGVGSRLRYYSLQNWSNAMSAIHLNSQIAGKDSNLTSVSVNLGCSWFRSESQSMIQGSGANVDMFSLCVADREQEFDQRTLQLHLAPHARSDLLYKNALLDRARTIFSGLIFVEENAQQTDAYQTNRNLLLSHQAEANSLPGLEIKANDVKCSHGATTGQIDEEELFYLQARGIPPRKAMELMVFGFFEEILEHFENPSIAEEVRLVIEAKFHDHDVEDLIDA